MPYQAQQLGIALFPTLFFLLFTQIPQDIHFSASTTGDIPECCSNFPDLAAKPMNFFHLI